MEIKSWQDHELVLISALEHYSYCPRQCALIHLEQTYDENIHTLRGSLFHERVDEGDRESRGEIRIERAVPIWSERLGLVGKTDVVEFHGHVPFPVEYKVGPKRKWGHDDIQVCAQAICIEEMTGIKVPSGAIYHHGSRKRRDVEFTDELKKKVEEAVKAIRQMILSDIIPPPLNDARCRHCSLIESCIPSVVAEKGRIKFLNRTLFNPENE